MSWFFKKEGHEEGAALASSWDLQFSSREKKLDLRPLAKQLRLLKKNDWKVSSLQHPHIP